MSSVLVTEADCKSVATASELKRLGWTTDTVLYRALAQRYCERNGLILWEFVGHQHGKGKVYHATKFQSVVLPDDTEEADSE
jgi:hypothetical protein